MKFVAWKSIAELVGIAAIVASLIFVGLELRQQQQMAVNESAYNVVENSREVRAALIEHADIWVRGNAGEELDRTEAAIYEELIRMLWARAFWSAITREAVGDDQNVAVHDFAAFLHQNPGARHVWESIMAVEQDYRDRLLSGPAGVALMNMVFTDLEKLGD